MAASDSELIVKSGTCYALFAYDAATSIDLDAAERNITARKQRETVKQKRRAPKHFEYHPPPLRITEDAQPIGIGRYETSPVIDMVLYDFGAVSVTYSVKIEGAFSLLLELSESLYDNDALLTDSRRRVEQLLEVISEVAVRPSIAEFVEDYVLFQVESFHKPIGISEFCTRHAQEVAQILRAERQPLSLDEVNDAVSTRISYGLDDVTIVDWNATLLLETDGDDVRAVLEFANVELLEMRYLDRSLDDALGRSYEMLARRKWNPSYGGAIADMRLVAQLQVDSAILFEGVNNALKLIGDQYLARLYRLISQRFHLAEWDATIIRKLDTLEGIYEKMSDYVSTRRLEVLEWIIIILIAVSILLPFFIGSSNPK